MLLFKGVILIYILVIGNDLIDNFLYKQIISEDEGVMLT